MAAPLATSIIFGVLTLMGIAYYLRDSKDPLAEWTVRATGVIQSLTFIAAIFAMLWAMA